MNKLLKKQLKYVFVVSPVVMLLSGCFALPHQKARQANGDNVGEVVIFTNVNSDSETASLFVNNKFIAALPEQHHVSHKFCEGTYQLTARSVKAEPTKDHKIVHMTGKYNLTVEPGTIKFLSLHRMADGWAFVPAKAISAGLKYNDPNLVRRVSNEMINCQ